MPARKKHPGGRPRKFHEPSHPVTVTLPERTLQMLASIDRDRARALVRVTDMALPNFRPPSRVIEIAEVAKGVGMLVVPPSKFLGKIKLVNMVEVAPSRFLLTIPSGTAIAEIEIAVADSLDHIPDGEDREKAILSEVLDVFRTLRRAQQIRKAEVLLVNV